MLKNRIPFEIFTPAGIVKSRLTIAIATIKAYCDINILTFKSTKGDIFFFFLFKG